MAKGDSTLKEPILITGCARSGTSLTAGVIHHCGGFGGELSGPTRYNEKGMFENNHIRETIVKPALKAVGADPLGQNPLPNINAFSPDLGEKIRGRVLATMRVQGLKEDRIWFYKGAKMCLMWTVWHKAFPKAKWVIVRRDTDEIINSCLRTGFMCRYKDEGGWREWVEAHEQKFIDMKAAGLNVMEVYPKQMVNSDFDQMKKVVKWVGLKWNEKRVLEFITPALWSNIKRKYEGVKQ